MYKCLTQEDRLVFTTHFPKDRVFSGQDIREEYGKDELGTVTHLPDFVIKVISAEEISSIMTYANAEKIPVVTRGSGTGLVGGCVPIHGGILIDTSKMNRIIALDEENLTLTVEAGVLLMDIYDFVESKGYFYAPDPGEKSATIGGNISTNAGGMRAVKYGVTRDWVRALEVVLPTGKIVQLGQSVLKDSTGYPLKQLMIGSEGTLGIITKAVLKLIPKPLFSTSILVPFASMEQSIKAVTEIGKSSVIPTAIEFFERQTLNFSEIFLGKKFPDKQYDYFLLMTFDGNHENQVVNDYQTIADLCLERLEAKDVFLVDTDERKEMVWKARGAFLEAIKASTTEMDECDVVIPRNKVADFLLYTKMVSESIDLRIPSFGHAGDGNLHIYLCRDALSSEEWSLKLSKGFDLLYKKAKEFGGLVSGEHGIGFAKKTYLTDFLGEEQIALMKGIKAVFDPNYILNPDKVI